MPDPQLLSLPLDAIDPGALPRDRTALRLDQMADLRRSLRRSGLRQPIEVFPLAAAEGAPAYGLLSGYRRLTAWRALRDEAAAARAEIAAEISAERAAERAARPRPRPRPCAEKPLRPHPRLPAPRARDRRRPRRRGRGERAAPAALPL